MKIKCKYCGTRFEIEDKYCPFCFTRWDKKLKPNPDECCDNKYVEHKPVSQHVEKEKTMQRFEDNRADTKARPRNAYRSLNTSRTSQRRNRYNVPTNRKQKPADVIAFIVIIYVIANILSLIF